MLDFKLSKNVASVVVFIRQNFSYNKSYRVCMPSKTIFIVFFQKHDSQLHSNVQSSEQIDNEVLINLVNGAVSSIMTRLQSMYIYILLCIVIYLSLFMLFHCQKDRTRFLDHAVCQNNPVLSVLLTACYYKLIRFTFFIENFRLKNVNSKSSVTKI